MFLALKKRQDSALKTTFQYAAVFAASAAAYATMHTFSGFPDPDSFYHVKMALEMRENGIVREFPWLPFTTLAEHFADHHFLYHLLLIPFVSVLGPLAGLTVASITFAAAALTAFYGLLRAYAVRWSAAYVLILGTSSAFAFRVNLAKAGALALIALFLALIAIRKERPLAVFAVAFAYVWLHGSWPVLLLVVGVWAAAKAVADRMTARHPWHSWAHKWFWKRLCGGSRHAWRDFFSATEVRIACAAISGILSGLVVNPYFPGNIRFYWEQIVQVAVVGYRDRIGVGSEWYPYEMSRLAAETGGPFILALLSLAVLAFVLFWQETIRRSRRAFSAGEIAEIAAAWMLAGVFLFLTLQSKRHVEYLVPLSVFASALLLHAIFSRLDVRAAKERLRALLPNHPVVLPALCTWFVALFLFIGIRDIVLVRSTYAGGIPYARYAPAATWLASRSPDGAVVLHSDWDDFPMLFLRNDRHRYVAGLDATFLYRRDPDRYRLWRDITTGARIEEVARLARERFGASFVFVENDHEAMLQAFTSDPGAVLAYHDAEATIFVLP